MAFCGYLKADTEIKVKIGPFVDVGDGFTPQTDIALSGNEAELLKHGVDAVVDISGATWAAVTNCRGYYLLTLTTSHTDTEGQITVIVQDDSDCLPVRNDFMVVNANVYDSLFAAATTDYLQVDALQLGGATQSATDLKDFADAGYDPATNKVQGVVLTDTCTTNTDQASSVVPQIHACEKAETSRTIDVFIEDDSAPGTGKTGLAYDTASLAWYYIREGAASMSEVTLATMTAGTWASGGFDEIDATNAPGMYQLGVPDAVLATSAKYATMYLQGAADMRPCKVHIDLMDSITVSATGEVSLLAATQASIDAIEEDTGTTIPGTITTAQADLDIITGTSGVVIEDGTITAAKLGADCITAAKIADDAISEEHIADGSLPAQGAPSATATPWAALMYLYKAWRNKADQTSTLYQLYDDAGTTVDHKATVGESGGTVTRQEVETGP